MLLAGSTRRATEAGSTGSDCLPRDEPVPYRDGNRGDQERHGDAMASRRA
jgi:hypothetical protein